MTTLDHRLYAWLAEADERRFERAFSAYYSVAFPALVRHLARRGRWDLALLEELAQDALMRFFQKVGRDRRAASEAVRAALNNIRPIHLGPFHERQVSVWTRDVSSFRDEVMGFRLGPTDESVDSEWKRAIHELAERIPPLRKQGLHLLRTVQLEVRWEMDAECAAQCTNKAQLEIESPEELMECDDSTSNAGPTTAIDLFAREVVAKTAQALAAEEKHPGIIPFVEHTYAIINAVPQLRVPTNGYLFQIAMTVYLDECKSRGRQKRGGISEGVGAIMHREIPSQHPVEIMTLDSAVETEMEDGPDFSQSRTVSDNSGVFAAPANDPTRQYEDEEFLERFYEYLRKPVDEAAEGYQKAQATGNGLAERRRLESLTNKLARMTLVLSMLGEGYTQESTAERLDLSRNQVKYIVELAQEAYSRFVAASTPAMSRASNIGGRSHAS
jgi:DNA-directed RNA polymerase specialized sigma24 family protein